LRGKLADVTAPAQERPSDVLNALLALGYSDKEAQAAIRGIQPGMPVAEGIRAALKRWQSKHGSFLSDGGKHRKWRPR
jgi:Holliday junction DNA helicase RuvA